MFKVWKENYKAKKNYALKTIPLSCTRSYSLYTYYYIAYKQQLINLQFPERSFNTKDISIAARFTPRPGTLISHITKILLQEYYTIYIFMALMIISIVYYSIGFTKSALKFWRKISNKGGGSLLILRKILVLVLYIFSHILFDVFNCRYQT